MAKMRPKMATMRPKIAKMRLKMGKMTPREHSLEKQKEMSKAKNAKSLLS